MRHLAVEGATGMPRVLIVDDNRIVRDMLKRHVATRPGVEIVEAGDGMRAVEIVRAKAPDMILMDLMMPGMDGIEAIRRIREDPANADIPILFLSTETDRAKWVEAFEAGANDFVQKPYEKRELMARMDTHLRLAALTRELRVKNALLEREQYLAGHVQSQLLPQGLDFPGFTASAVYQAQEQIGGDFYDAWDDGETVHVVMADISGHGASAALLMAVCKGLLYSLAKTRPDPGDMVAELNRMLYAMLEGGDLDMYVTLAFAAISRSRNTVSFLSAGHAPAYVLGQGVVALGPTGPGLGFHNDFTWETVTLPFGPGNTLFLLTDGVTELRAPGGEFFGEKRLLELLSGDAPPRELIGRVIDHALPFCKGRLTDDLAMLAIRRLPG
jgi:sigma-B regulation protein RsbU (phosphoserine phosphatase)